VVVILDEAIRTPTDGAAPVVERIENKVVDVKAADQFGEERVVRGE
jgi:hypothetical protein